MKRLAILVLLLVALALLVILSSLRRREGLELAPRPQSAQLPAGADLARTLEEEPSPPSESSAGERRAAVEDPGASSNGFPRRRLPPQPMDQDPDADATLRGTVVFAGTDERVAQGELELSYRGSGEARVVAAPGGAAHLSRSSAASFHISGRIGADGSFALPTRSTATLETLDVHLPGTVRADDVRYYVPTQVVLRKTLAEIGPLLRVEVRRGYELTGYVLDASSGAPIAGARIETSWNWTGFQDAASDAQGRFVLRGLCLADPAKEASLVCKHSEHIQVERAFPPAELAPGSPDLALRLRPGIVLAGRILDEADKPLWAVKLALELEHPRRLPGESQGFPPAGRSGIQGEFRFAALPGCARAWLVVDEQCPHGRVVPAQRIALGALPLDSPELVVHLATAVSLVVRAELPDGTPLARRQWTLVCPQSAAAFPGMGGTQIVGVPLGTQLQLHAFAPLENDEIPHAYRHGVTRAYFATAPGEPPSATIVLSEELRFDIPPAPEGAPTLKEAAPALVRAALDVQLVDAASGAPFEDVPRTRLRLDGGPERETTLTKGWVRLEGTPGKHRLHLQLGRLAETELELTIPVSGHGSTIAPIRTDS